MKINVKQKTLSQQLRDLNIGETVEVSLLAYRTNYIRQAARRICEKMGRDYKVTEKGLPTSCKVTRVR